MKKYFFYSEDKILQWVKLLIRLQKQPTTQQGWLDLRTICKKLKPNTRNFQNSILVLEILDRHKWEDYRHKDVKTHKRAFVDEFWKTL